MSKSVLCELRKKRRLALQGEARFRDLLRDLEVAICAIEAMRPHGKKRAKLRSIITEALQIGPAGIREIFARSIGIGDRPVKLASIGSTLSRMKADGEVVKTPDDKWTLPKGDEK